MINMTNSKFGTVTFEGKEYSLTSEAVTTGRSLNNGQNFNDKSDGETYEFEMSADAIDEYGNACRVCWIFEDIKGENGQDDLSNFDYDKVDRVVEQ